MNCVLFKQMMISYKNLCQECLFLDMKQLNVKEKALEGAIVKIKN